MKRFCPGDDGVMRPLRDDECPGCGYVGFRDARAAIDEAEWLASVLKAVALATSVEDARKLAVDALAACRSRDSSRAE